MERLDNGTAVAVELLRSRYAPLDEKRLVNAVEHCSVEDWRYAVQFHGVAGLLARFHSEAIKNHLPQALQDELAVLTRRQRLSALVQAGYLQEILARFESEAITVVPIKGLALSSRLYGDIAVRSSGDIDILIDPDDLDTSLAVLSKLGWCLYTKLDLADPILRRRLLTYLHHRVLVRDDGTRLELHWRSSDSPYLAIPRLRSLSDQLIERTSNGLTYLDLPDQWQVHLVGTHCAHARMGRLKWGVDVLDLLAAQDGPTRSPATTRSIAIARTLAHEKLRLPAVAPREMPAPNRAIVRHAQALEETRLVERDEGRIAHRTKILEAVFRQAAHLLEHRLQDQWRYLVHLMGWRASVIVIDEPVPVTNRLYGLYHNLTKLVGF